MKKSKIVLILMLCLSMLLSAVPAHAAGTGSYSIRVTDKYGTVIPGATVKFEDITAGVATATLLGTSVTGADGIAKWTSLDDGWYRATLFTVPDGYILDTSPEVVRIVTADAATKDPVVDIKIDTMGTLDIVCLDGESRVAIPGASFQVTRADGTLVGSYTTGSDGKITVPKLTNGTYKVTCMSVPAGYVYAPETNTVVIKANSVTESLFELWAKPFIDVFSYIKGTSIPVEGAFYELQDSHGVSVASGVSDASGKVVFKDLVPGIYNVIFQSAPDGYNVETTLKTANVQVEKGAIVDFVYTRDSAILIKCVDSHNNPLEGTVFQLRDYFGKAIGLYTTDIEGTVYTETLAPGKYLIQEMIATENFIPDSYTRTVEVKNNLLSEELFTNNEKSCIVVYSYDSYGVVVPNTQYKVKNTQTGVEIDTINTDSNGVGTSKVLEPGLYMVEEVNIPMNYVLEKPAYNYVYVGINQSSALRFIHTPKSVIRITTCDENGVPIEGVKYLVTNVKFDYTANFISDANGEALTEVLMPGIYEVKQISVPEGYELNTVTKTLTVTSDSIELAPFINKATSGLVIKASTYTGHAPVAGCVFEVYNSVGTLVGHFVSDAAGEIILPKLAPGKYEVKEISSPDEYTIKTPTLSIEITTGDYKTVEFYHTVKAGVVVTVKDASNGSVLPGVSVRIIKSNGDFVGDYTTDAAGQIIVSPMIAGEYRLAVNSVPEGYLLDASNVSFVIKEETVTRVDLEIDKAFGVTLTNTCKQDGTVIANASFKITLLDGTLVGNCKTDSKGRFNISLEPGTYRIYQTHVPAGYVLSTEVRDITVPANKILKIEWENEIESGIRVRIVDKESGKGIYNVGIRILDYKNNIVGNYKTDNSGYVELDDLIAVGKYKIRMTSVPSGYTIDDQDKTIVVELGETTSLVWKITGIKGQIKILTYAGEDSTMAQVKKNTLLHGVAYNILDSNGDIYASITDSNGYCYSGALPLGTYYVEQVGAPAGFAANSKRVTVNVIQSNQDVQITVYDAAVNYAPGLDVRGPVSLVAGQNGKFYLPSISGSTTNPMQNFFLNVKLPTDCLRFGTFYTGTYNQYVIYSIQIKTNLNTAYRTLASNLSSSSSYSYNLDSVSLGLGAGEYVTDVRLVFPNVYANFKSSTAPSWYASALSTVPSGYQYRVNAEIGGMVNGSYYTNAGSFSGIIYGNGSYYNGNSYYNYYYSPVPGGVYPNIYQVPSVLPKTGN